MVKHLDLYKAVDYLIDETPEGAPFRDDADLCRLSDRQRSNRWEKRRRFALPLIVRACADGTWKASGQRPGSAYREHIPQIDFERSNIDVDTGHLMARPGGGHLTNPPGDGFIGGGARLRGGQIRFKPGEWKPVNCKVAKWTELMFSVPSGADEGGGAELPEPTDPRSSVVRPNRAGRRTAAQTRTPEVWAEFDKIEKEEGFTFERGELTRIKRRIAEKTGYKPNTVEKIIRARYKELEAKRLLP